MTRRLWSVAAVLTVAAFTGLAPGTAGAAGSMVNIVESVPLTGSQNDFNNSCTSGYYGNTTLGIQGNHSETDLAVNPKNGSLLGASKFFFGASQDVAGYTDFSPQYNFHLGSYSISSAGSLTNEGIIPGYSDGPQCQGSGDSKGIHWTNSTDPNVAFASNGDAFTSVLPYTQGTKGKPNGAIFVNKMAAGASTWSAPVLASPLYGTNGTGQGPDKEWVATYYDAAAKTEYVNACWAVFHGFWGSQVFCSRSTDGGATFLNASNPFQISSSAMEGPFNTYVYPRYDSNGTLYVTYMALKGSPVTDAAQLQGSSTPGNFGVLYTRVSTDQGKTFGPAMQGFKVQILPYHLNHTTFRDGIPYFMYASPKYAGHLYAVAEDYSAGNANVYLYESKNGGQTWSASSAANAVEVNDNPASDTSDQFQPSITADGNGNVGVAWYDRRHACPADDPLTPNQANTCVDTYAQLFKDNGSSLLPNGGNQRASNTTWDPQLPMTPAQPNCNDDLVHPGGNCGTSFIGDYFGTAIANGKLYILNISTANTFAGVDNANHDQVEVLQIIPIT